ncbi:MAG: hypothetical protein RL108_763 [Bacteroidota bacterium]|jgi:hypothetical protein
MKNSIQRYYHFLVAKKRFFGLGLIYLICSLIIGEFHPFSRFPMYNSFPNWSYVFYYTDNNGKLITAKRLQTNTGYLAHTFYTACETLDIEYGNGIETKQDLNQLGREITNQVNQQIKLPIAKKVKLHRLFFFKKANKIFKNDVIIYEGYIR